MALLLNSYVPPKLPNCSIVLLVEIVNFNKLFAQPITIYSTITYIFTQVHVLARLSTYIPFHGLLFGLKILILLE